MKKRAGFTIIELLIVIAIIVVLSSVVIVAYSGYREKSRDAKRKTDLSDLRHALELYISNTENYPETDGNVENVAGSRSYIYDLLAVGKYISNVPIDPQGSYYMHYNDNYCGGTDNKIYSFYAKLEAPSSSDTATMNIAYARCNDPTQPPIATYGMNYRAGN